MTETNLIQIYTVNGQTSVIDYGKVLEMNEYKFFVVLANYLPKATSF
jgi:hypothetical protein